ncbi:Ig-like domain-containing protein [Ruminococcus sp. LCP21S3_E8]|nr:Ig-like domain-containing protein [Ruminococcus sp.]MDD6531845.1 Ig-like domain-containing protein [Ruminococcus sp.]
MRKVVSILLAVLMLTAMGTVAVTSASAEETATVNGVVANVGDTVTIDYFIKSDCIWECFQGHVTYDYDGLQLESFEMPDVTTGIMTNTLNKGFAYYTGVDIYSNYKFYNEVNFYRIKFTVRQAGSYAVNNVLEFADGNNADMIVDDGVILKPERLITREVVTATPKPTETTTNTTAPKPTTKPEPTNTEPSSTPSPSTPVAVSGVALNKKVATINVGKTVTVKATVTPANAANKTLAWTSSNTKIATVSNGVVKGVKAGRVVITAKTTDGSNISATCTVTVKQPVTSISLSKKATMYTGKKLTLKAKVNPANASNKALTWKSYNTKIAKVASNGVVTGVKAGTVKITATAKDGSRKSATCTVTVRQSVSKITLSKTNVVLPKKGSSYNVKVTVAPKNAYNKNVAVKSAKTKVAKVSASTVKSGKTVKITAVKKGTTKVVFTAKDGSKKSATCKVTVKK